MIGLKSPGSQNCWGANSRGSWECRASCPAEPTQKCKVSRTGKYPQALKALKESFICAYVCTLYVWYIHNNSTKQQQIEQLNINIDWISDSN